MDEQKLKDIELKAKEIADDVKELVKEGNVTRIKIRKNDTIILNIPMTAGVLGTAVGLMAAPWTVIIATLTTIGLNCNVEVEKKDGTVIVVHGKENDDEEKEEEG